MSRTPKRDYLQVVCPRCFSERGEPCRNDQGELADPHENRRRLLKYVETFGNARPWLSIPCPECGAPPEEPCELDTGLLPAGHSQRRDKWNSLIRAKARDEAKSKELQDQTLLELQGLDLLEELRRSLATDQQRALRSSEGSVVIAAFATEEEADQLALNFNAGNEEYWDPKKYVAQSFNATDENVHWDTRWRVGVTRWTKPEQTRLRIAERVARDLRERAIKGKKHSLRSRPPGSWVPVEKFASERSATEYARAINENEDPDWIASRYTAKVVAFGKGSSSVWEVQVTNSRSPSYRAPKGGATS